MTPEEFEAFREECVWCCIVFNTHQSLFDAGAEVDTILKETSHHLFQDLSVMSQEYHVILVGRLTDPPESNGRANLTVRRIVEVLGESGFLTSEIIEVADRLQEYRSRIEMARNKLVAHRDVSAVLRPTQTGSWAKQEVQDFHKNLNRFCDLVAPVANCQPCEFARIPVATFPLIQTLRAGIKARKRG